MKSDMGIPWVHIPELCGHSTSTPDKQLNRQVFYFIFFLFEWWGASAGGAVTW